MGTLEFILQGFTSKTHGDVLRRLFDLPDVQRVLVSVAFVNEAGVAKIATLLSHAPRVTVFAGIRNGVTSYQGLARLNDLVREIYTVDTGSRTVIFHPKIYLVRGINHARLIIGSANLTLAGLNNNVEAGMFMDFDLSIDDDVQLVDNIEELFAGSLADYPLHIVKVGSVADLDRLLAAGRLVDERIAHEQSDSPETEEGDQGKVSIGSDGERLPPIKLKTASLRSGFIKVHGGQKANRDSHENTDVAEEVNLRRLAMLGEIERIRILRSKIECERESKVTHYIKRRAGEGRNERARRARKEAKILGKKWYYTGDPCRYGHLRDRLVSNAKCRECNRLDNERSNRLGLYR